MINKGLLHDHVLDYTKLQILEGSLEDTPILGVTHTPATHLIRVEWGVALGGSKKDSDHAIVVLIQNDEVMHYAVSVRGSLDYFIATTVDAPRLQNGRADVYLCFAQEPTPGTGETGLNSRTFHKSVTISGIPTPTPVDGTPSATADSTQPAASAPSPETPSGP